MARNYRSEYDNYQGTTKQKKRRAQRNKERRKAIRKGRVSLGDGVDLDHKDGNPFNHSKSNVRKQSKSTNRSFPRNKNAGKK